MKTYPDYCKLENKRSSLMCVFRQISAMAVTAELTHHLFEILELDLKVLVVE